MEIRPLKEPDLVDLKSFTDSTIGTGYYSQEELLDIYQRSQKNGKMCSFLLIQDGQILGFRLTYPPGQWNHGKGRQLSPHLWRVTPAETAYFQSLFLHPSVQGGGWGQKLSEESIKVLQSLGAKAVVCHSWVESPHNSSSKYLQKLGFTPLIQYPYYWKNVDYDCPRCGKPCLCTAEEMILYLFIQNQNP